MRPFADAFSRFRPRLLAAGPLLALFLVVVGARFWLIERDARSLPFWDPWNGVGDLVLRPWLHGTLDWRALFAPHNEHRIVLTRLWSLALVAANGQWDNRLETAANALLWGGTAVWLARTLTAALGPAFRRRVLLAVAVAFVLPFGWENTLSGFQSQNYFLLLFSLVAIRGLGYGRPGSGGWWAGGLASGLAALSMASGFLAAVVVPGLRGARLIRERRLPGAGELLTAGWCLGVAAAGLLTRTAVAGHAALRAESSARFVAALGRYLAWPLSGWPGLGLFALLPLLGLAVVSGRRVRPDRAAPAGAGLLLGFGGWGLLQIAALAYGRGGQGALPSPRYTDLLAVMVLVNFLAWQVFAARARGTPWRGPALAGAALFLALTGGGLWAETALDSGFWLPWYSRWLERGESNLRGYVLTGDFDRFLKNKAPDELPYPDARLLASLVDDPALRAVLPADLRPPLALQPEVSPGFVPGGGDPAVGAFPGGKTWGSFTARTGAGEGTFRASLPPGSGLPYLRFAFSGFSGTPGLRFALTGRPGAPRREWRLPRGLTLGGWHEYDLRRPAGPACAVLAEDHGSTGWLAFSEPVEVGFWSRWAAFFLRRGGAIAAAGAGLGLGLELGALPEAWAAWRRRRRAAAGSPPPDPAARSLRLLSVVIPARDEAGGIVATVESLHAELRARNVPHEIVVVDDGSRDQTWPLLLALTALVPALRPVRNPGPHGFGRAVVYGLDRMQGDAVVVMMADASDAPADVVRYWTGLSEGYDCVFGSRFVRGGRVHGYPWLKLSVNRLANRFIQRLFHVGLNDTTNAFKAYRREVIEGCRPLISAQFNLTVELPLKAIVRGFTWTVVPISWHNRRTGAAKFRLREMGSRYLFICLYLWLEKHLSRGDYLSGGRQERPAPP